MRYITTTLAVAALAVAAVAQTWNEDYRNAPFNLRYESANPVRVAYNPTLDYAVADVDYLWTRGDYHAVDESGKAGQLNAYIGGLRHIGRFDLAGHLSYRNREDKDQAWGNQLWASEGNPFEVCDSLLGDATTESFDLLMTAAYALTDRLHLGIEAGLATGSRADQSDPRPRTMVSLIPVTLGVDYAATDAWSFGLTGGADFYNSRLEYSNVQPGVGHTYFLMKGMGDYARRSTNDESGYQRDVKRTAWRAGASAVWQPADGAWSNLLEAGFATASEKATDGGSQMSFKGGDYEETRLTALDRVQLRRAARLHNLTLRGAYASGEATWYDQKRETDFEHGNVQYYRVLGSTVNHKVQRLSASLAYQLDLLRDGERDLYVGATAAFDHTTRKQIIATGTPEQTISRLSLDAVAGKAVAVGRTTLVGQVDGGYTIGLTADYANGTTMTGKDDIAAVWTRRVFEYESAASARVGALVDASAPVGHDLTVGLYARYDLHIYAGDEETWQGYDGQSLSDVRVGAYLRF